MLHSRVPQLEGDFPLRFGNHNAVVVESTRLADTGGVGSIGGFDHLSLDCIALARIRESLDTVREGAMEEVPRCVALLVNTREVGHCVQVLRLDAIEEEL